MINIDLSGLEITWVHDHIFILVRITKLRNSIGLLVGFGVLGSLDTF